MRRKLLTIFLILTIVFSVVGCDSHIYTVSQIEEKTNAELDSREVYRGEEWEHITYYFAKDSDEYQGVYFYLFDSSKDARRYYQFSVDSLLDNDIKTHGDYAIGDSYGGEVIDRLGICLCDNLVVYISMESTYCGEDGTSSHTSLHDESYIQDFVSNW